MAKAIEASPVDSVISSNDELIDALQKQVEVLYNRLDPVSSRHPNDETSADRAGVRGSSTMVEKLGKQNYQLQNLSDRLSRMTRELEI